MKIRVGHIQITVAVLIVIVTLVLANYLSAFFSGYIPNMNQKISLMEEQGVELSQEDLFQLNATLTMLMFGMLTIIFGIAAVIIVLSIILFFQGLIHMHDVKKSKFLDLFDHHFVVTALLTLLTLFMIVFLLNL